MLIAVAYIPNFINRSAYSIASLNSIASLIVLRRL